MITLRDFCPADKDLLVQYLNDQEVTQYLSADIPSPYTFDDANWWLEKGCKQGITKAILWRGEFCGAISATPLQGIYAHSAEIGYWLGHQFWGKGIGTQALIDFTNLLWRSTELQRLFNPVSAPNIASCRVMEKAGYQLEAKLRKAVKHQGVFYDELLYYRLKDPH